MVNFKLGQKTRTNETSFVHIENIAFKVNSHCKFNFL